MPTYDYRCKACNHRWELFQAITADPVKKCPACKKAKAERVIGPGAGILFKGTGFYQTDYRSDSYKKSAEADSKSSEPAKSESSGGDSGKPSTSTESKPATKSDSKK